MSDKDNEVDTSSQTGMISSEDATRLEQEIKSAPPIMSGGAVDLGEETLEEKWARIREEHKKIVPPEAVTRVTQDRDKRLEDRNNELKMRKLAGSFAQRLANEDQPVKPSDQTQAMSPSELDALRAQWNKK